MVASDARNDGEKGRSMDPDPSAGKPKRARVKRIRPRSKSANFQYLDFYNDVSELCTISITRRLNYRDVRANVRQSERVASHRIQVLRSNSPTSNARGSSYPLLSKECQ